MGLRDQKRKREKEAGGLFLGENFSGAILHNVIHCG
jgi:hypothetical protein